MFLLKKKRTNLNDNDPVGLDKKDEEEDDCWRDEADWARFKTSGNSFFGKDNGLGGGAVWVFITGESTGELESEWAAGTEPPCRMSL